MTAIIDESCHIVDASCVFVGLLLRGQLFSESSQQSGPHFSDHLIIGCNSFADRPTDHSILSHLLTDRR